MPDKTAIGLRDALVSHWGLDAEGPDRQAHVLNVSSLGDLALFLVRRRVLLLLIPLEAVPEWNTIATIEQRIRGLLTPAEGLFLAGTKDVIHVVFLGGDHRVRSWVQQVRFHSDSLARAVTFHHATIQEGDLDIWHASGAHAWLDTALKATADILAQGPSPLTPSQLAGLLADARIMVEENRVWGTIMRRPTHASRWLAAAVALVFVLQLFWSDGAPDGMTILWLMGACSRELVSRGDYWRLMAAAFLHAGFIHMALNFYVLFRLGPFVERMLGLRRFLILYGLSALGGSLATVFLSPTSTVVGASTALCGLIAALAMMAWRNGELFASTMVRQLRRDLVINLLLIVIVSLLPGISLAGHLGGMVAGALLVGSGLLVRGVPPVREKSVSGSNRPTDQGSAPPPQRGVAGLWDPVGTQTSRGGDGLLSLGAVIVTLAMVGAIGMGIRQNRPWILRDRPLLERVRAGHLPFSVALPNVLQNEPVVSLEHPDLVTFGVIGRTPLLVDVVTAPWAQVPVGDDPTEFLKSFVASAQFQGMRVRSDQDGHPMVVGHKTYGEASITRGATLSEGYLVTINVLNVSGLPTAWAALAQEIPTTLRFEPGDRATLSDIPSEASPQELKTIALHAQADGRRRLAEKALKRLVELTPNDATVWKQLGSIALMSRRFEVAEAAYRKALSLNSDDPASYQGLGLALLQLGRPDEAEQAFREQEKRRPERRVWVDLARAQLDMQQWTDAMASLHKAQSSGGRDPNVDFLLGQALIGAGRRDDALARFRAILDVSSDPIWANDIAYTLAENDLELDWALELAQESVDKQRTALARLAPDQIDVSAAVLTASLGHAWDTLGTILMKRGDLDRAGPYLQAAWVLTGIGETALHLGEWWQEKGDTRAAAEWYDLAATFPKEAKEAREKRQALPPRPEGLPIAPADRVTLPVRAPLGPPPPSAVDPGAQDDTAPAGTEAVPETRNRAMPSPIPVYVLVGASKASKRRIPAGSPLGIEVWDAEFRDALPATAQSTLAPAIRQRLQQTLPPVVFPDQAPLRLVIPARVHCAGQSPACHVRFLSPERVAIGWDRDLPE